MSASSLKASYAACGNIARRAAGNFFYSFLLLPRAKRRAMCAVYSFLRHTDDLGDCDEPAETRRTKLNAWRAALASAFDGAPAHDELAILPALLDTVQTFGIPREYLFAAIDGVEMDLTERTYETFADLEDYCYKVASVVGLSCIHIWGFSDRAAIEPACRLGVAFQLTNILRDLKEDADRGRVYLPQEDLRRFGYSGHDVARGVRDERFTALMNFEIARAAALYRDGEKLDSYLARDSRAGFRAMFGIYRGLLGEIARRGGDVFSSRVRLSGWRKASIAARSFFVRPTTDGAQGMLGAPHG